MKLVYLVAAVAALSSPWGQAHASTKAVDFTTLSTTPGDHFTLSADSGAGVIALSQPATSAASDGYAEFATNFGTSGDFTAQIQVDITKAPAGTDTGSVEAFFFVGPGDDYLQMSTFNIDTGGAMLDAEQGTVAGFSSLDASVSAFANQILRVERVGDVITESFAPVGSTDFTTLFRYSGAGLADDAVFELGAIYSGTSGATGSVRFSNFMITTADAGGGGDGSGGGTGGGTPGAVPEPATWAMMIGGLGAAGAVLRRRQRRATGTVRYA